MPKIGLIDLKDLFIEVDNQDIDELPDEFRIYYGTAWFNKIPKQENYNVRFSNNLLCEGVHAQPSAFIPKLFIEQSSYTRFNELNFVKLVSKIPKKVFILTESGPFLKGGKYINIWLEGLEYIEYRNLK